MPATKYDWEAIELHYNTTGRDFAATAKAMGVPKNTLIVRATRKGWKTPGNALRKIEEGREEMKEMVPHVVTMNPVDAVKATIEEQRDKFIGGISHGLSRAAQEIGRMDAGSIISNSRDIKNVVDSAKVIYNLGGDQSSASVSINLLSLDASTLAGRVSVSPTL
jgi:hypothetical protein